MARCYAPPPVIEGTRMACMVNTRLRQPVHPGDTNWFKTAFCKRHHLQGVKD